MEEIKSKYRYKTKQEALIINFFKSNCDESFTADEVFASIAQEGISRATVYRRIERLAEEGVLLKYNLGNGAGAIYQYCNHGNDENCFHFVCTKCKTLHHLDCSVFKDVQQHLNLHHHLLIDGNKTIFYGLCEECL